MILVPNHKSAAKRMRQNEKQRVRNRHSLSTVRTYVKHVRTALEASDGEAAKAALPVAIRALDRAAGKGLLHRNQARRTIGRLESQVHALNKG